MQFEAEQHVEATIDAFDGRGTILFPLSLVACPVRRRKEPPIGLEGNPDPLGNRALRVPLARVAYGAAPFQGIAVLFKASVRHLAFYPGKRLDLGNCTRQPSRLPSFQRLPISITGLMSQVSQPRIANLLS